MVDLGDGAAPHYPDREVLHGLARSASAGFTLRAAKSFQAAANSSVRLNSSDSASHIALRAVWSTASSVAASGRR